MTAGRSTRSLRSLLVGVAIVVGLVLVVWSIRIGPEAEHPEWATVTKEIAAASPFVVAARYDPANHFILVDVAPGVTDAVALRHACETVRPMLERVDSTVSFALYAAPDRLLAHRDDCVLGS